MGSGSQTDGVAEWIPIGYAYSAAWVWPARKTVDDLALPGVGAGDGNRTHVVSLEGWSSTIELHPPMLASRLAFSYRLPVRPDARGWWRG